MMYFIFLFIFIYCNTYFHANKLLRTATARRHQQLQRFTKSLKPTDEFTRSIYRRVSVLKRQFNLELLRMSTLTPTSSKFYHQETRLAVCSGGFKIL